jgi:glycolate oxidase iron-sulfur subunit
MTSAQAAQQGNGSRSAFDGHHPPSLDLIDDCVHCGFCLPSCPTYALWGEEMDSPRGRIYLMKLGSEGRIGLGDTLVRHIDQCLGCMACVTACPSGVQYEKLIEATRAQVERRYTRSLGSRVLRRIIFALFPRPGRLSFLCLPLWLYQRSGIQWLTRRSGLLKLLPEGFRGMESMLPVLRFGQWRSKMPKRIPAQGAERGKAALLLGCVQRVFFANVNAATARVLSAEGFEVIIPKGQGCCGALMVHSGLEEEALNLARKTIDEFERAGADLIVTNAAGCGSTLKEYGHLLRDDPEYAERARAFSAKCKDVSEVLAHIEPRAPRTPLNLRVVYQDACHLQHAQGVRSEPRKVLGTIPGLQVVEIEESGLCCGSAGIYNMIEPKTARDLGDRKVANILAAAPDAIISSNPGCLLQISAGMDRAGSKPAMAHLVELLDASIQARPGPETQSR